MTFINLTGIEIECSISSIPDGFKFHNDSSVEGFGNDIDNCECYDSCECNECYICSLCENNCELCSCDSCLYCESCQNEIDDCECSFDHLSTCENPKCNDNDVCDNCIEYGLNNRTISHNCFVNQNYSRNCNMECSCTCECRENNGYVGEIVSDPIRVDQLAELFQRALDIGFETNHTCGNHQHFSFKSNISYMILTDERFYNFYLHEISKWGHEKKINPDSQFWRRLRGENHFCKYGFNPEDQIYMKEHYMSERYTHLNYCYNVDNRKTLEIRLLPAFQKNSLALDGFMKNAEIINKWLELNPNKWNLNKIELFARIEDD